MYLRGSTTSCHALALLVVSSHCLPLVSLSCFGIIEVSELWLNRSKNGLIGFLAWSVFPTRYSQQPIVSISPGTYIKKIKPIMYLVGLHQCCSTSERAKDEIQHPLELMGVLFTNFTGYCMKSSVQNGIS